MNNVVNVVMANGNLFRRVLPHKNFLTPKVLNYYNAGDYEIELSEGDGLYSKPIYGVTFVDIVAQKHLSDISHMFESSKEAMDYIRTFYV